MAKSSFKGLSLIRKDNQKKVVSILKKYGNASCAQLSSTLNLSNVALYNIMEDLRQKNIVKAMSDKSTIVGRKPSIYALNESFGLFAVVDYSSAKIRINVFDINGENLISEETDERYILSIDDVYESISILKSMLKNKKLLGLSLKAICVSTPGRINKNTGYFWVAAKFKDCANINLHKIFSENFDCAIDVKNDMHVALIGHKSIEPFASVRSALYFHIGESAGAALYINGEIYEGENGYAGEFGSMTDFSEHALIPQISLSSMAMRYVRRTLDSGSREKMLELGNIVDFSGENFVEKYLQGDETALDIADNSAKILAIAISNLVVMLDLSTVIINGNLSLLGDKYLDAVNEYVHANVFSKTTKCCFSPLGDKAILLGATETAVQTGIYAALEQSDE